MGDPGLGRGAELADGVLNGPVGIGHALVLPQVLEPRCDHERLQKASALGGVLEDVPGICAITPSLLFQVSDGDEEGFAALRGDAVFDRNQDWPAVGVCVDCQYR